MLSKDWTQRKPRYDFVIVGSGYGGSITAARLATAGLAKPVSVCVLERGKEWVPGTFPDSPEGYLANLRNDLNPLGLYEVLPFRDISVLKGSGLGGTSLVNANVAIRPDAEVFEELNWPKSLTLAELRPYYMRAEQALNVSPHPRATELKKVQALQKRAEQIGTDATALPLAVTFQNGPNPQGVDQNACTDCGDCVSGCNVKAKNTLYMNYLPMAQKAGADIFTQMTVEWVEKIDGGWRVHGVRHKDVFKTEKFSIDASNVVLSAGSINSTEILLRSAVEHKLPLSPAIGTGFGGNGDFFGLSYNSDVATQVLGFGTPPPADVPALVNRPGPTIVAAVRYNHTRPIRERFTIEDLSFAKASVRGAQIGFATFPREDSDTGDELEEAARISRDLFGVDKYTGALNHTMLYLCMGFDDARGVFRYEKGGRIQVNWDGVGQQQVFARINEELKRHTRALGGSFVANPLWALPVIRHLVTAHPLGGCIMSDDYLQGATDEFGRVYKNDGSVHDGLFVADGALLPSALGVNPFLTISAVSERIVQKRIDALNGQPYPKPKKSVGFAGVNPLDVIGKREVELERMFQAATTLGIDVMVNKGGKPNIDKDTRVIRNDTAWKGYFPAHHVLNQMSALISTSFQKRFEKKGSKYAGVTSDTDGRIRATNSLEEIEIKKPTGDLAPGKYILLRYLEPQWSAFYDIFKVIHKDLLIGRVYLGPYPNGQRLITFPMTRTYGFDNMKVEDHRLLWDRSAVPTKQELDGVWRMDTISNANQTAGIAHLHFTLQPDGRLESRYQLMGLFEGLVMPSFAANHFRLTDFTPFHDEIRKVAPDLMIGKYIVELPAETAALPAFGSLGVFHQEMEEGGGRPRFGFYYLLTKTDLKKPPTTRLFEPFLDARLPEGLGLQFDEEMVGHYYPGQPTPAPGRKGDLTIADRGPSPVECKFNVRMMAADLNEFVEGAEHEARMKGTITFSEFDGQGPVTFPIDERKSLFNYLRVNQATGEAEMRYHIEFDDRRGRRIIFEGRKYMQKDEMGGIRGPREVLDDYTTLYVHVSTGGTELGTGLLKFRTFEDLAAFGNLAGFLTSFRTTGTNDPLLQLRGQMKFLAFTGQFVQQEYDPLTATSGALRDDVREEVLRGADTPDSFSTRSTEELQTMLRETPTLGLSSLLNQGGVRIDVEQRRVFRDSFWKGTFAKDTLLGMEERLRNAALGNTAEKLGTTFTGGSYWKRFDEMKDGVVTGHVVNYELQWLPGHPAVREVEYPNDGRRYFKKGDTVLLLQYQNDPYRMVYDTIKVIDQNNALGVMHIGNYPDGVEVATFSMTRHNYPLEKMSVEDHHLLMADRRVTVPVPGEIGGDWSGHLVLLQQASFSLLNQANPVIFRCRFAGDGTASYSFTGVEGTYVQDPDGLKDVRRIDANTLMGVWELPSKHAGLLMSLQNVIEAGGKLRFYFVLTR